MSDTKTHPTWKRILLMAMTVYAGLSTLSITVLLALLIWAVLHAPTPADVTEEDLKALGFSGSDLKHELQRKSLLNTNSETGLRSKSASQPTH